MQRLAWRQPDSRVHVLVDEDGNVVRSITTMIPTLGNPDAAYHVMTDGRVESSHASLEEAMRAAEAAAL
jgi:hypothetical protein